MEYFPNGSPDRRRNLPSVVVEAFLRGKEQFTALWRPQPVADLTCLGQTGCIIDGHGETT